MGSRSVISNQESLYKNLEATVKKYASTEYLRPVAEHTQIAFREAAEFVKSFYKVDGDVPEGKRLSVILDSGCGLGESTFRLAFRFPGFPVIGIDKSVARLEKGRRMCCIPENVLLVRAELVDFWRLTLEFVKTSRWVIPYHALYYPNPWPKQSEATRRFHLHPVFPALIALSQETELRTNWEIYAREFKRAAEIVWSESGCEGENEAEISTFVPDECVSAFERKYHLDAQTLWKVRLHTLR